MHSYCQLFVLLWDKTKLDVIISMLTSFVAHYLTASMVFLSPLAFIWQGTKSAIITSDRLLFLNLCSLISYYCDANTKSKFTYHARVTARVAEGELCNEVNVDDWKWKKLHKPSHKKSKKRSKHIQTMIRCIAL